MSRSRTNKTTKQADNGNDHFPPTTALPDTSPSILLCFVGLMGFAYNDHGFCEVGMHCKAPKHDFSISLYDEFSDFDKPLYAFRCGPAQNSPVDIIRLNIVNPTPETKDVSFLISPDIKHDPDLGKILGDQLDFRSLPDLESSDFYRRKLKKKPGAFKPRIFIKSGIICALSTGGSIFKAVAPDASQVIGEVADVVFAAIYLNQDGYVSLRIGSDELKLTTAKHYFVVFDNRCPPSECHFDPESTKKEERNDFYLYTETFEIPEDLEEYELVLKDTHITNDQAQPDAKTAVVVPAAFTKFSPALIGLLEQLFSTNDAPCGGAGYGGSNGLGDGTP